MSESMDWNELIVIMLFVYAVFVIVWPSSPAALLADLCNSFLFILFIYLLIYLVNYLFIYLFDEFSSCIFCMIIWMI